MRPLDLVIVMFGGNDGQDLQTDTHPAIRFGTSEFLNQYEARVRAVIT
jgi:hypothetical protein